MMRDWCIIPARGGSKRIPGKNIVEFNGVPLIEYTIYFALESECFDKVFVSTDCEKIQRIAINAGAEASFLRADCNDDITPVSEATISTVNQIIQTNGKTPDFITQMMPNCPIRFINTLKDLREEQSRRKVMSYISASKYSWFNPFWAHSAATNAPVFTKFHQMRSQDLPKVLTPTGTIWRARWPALQKYNSFYMPMYKLFEISLMESIDIDDFEDLEFAKIIHKGLSLV